MAHALWRAVARKGDLAVDATAGNGWDTAALAELVLGDDGEDPGVVLAFDVQARALESTRRRVDERFDEGKASRVRLVLDSHARLGEYVGEYVGDDDETTAMTSVDDDDDADAPPSDFTKKKKEKKHVPTRRSPPAASASASRASTWGTSPARTRIRRS